MIAQCFWITLKPSANSSLGIPIIKGKTDADGKCRIYAERLQYTPLFDVLVQSSYGIALKMETADNSAFEGGFEATVE